jgi:adenylate cyclase
MLPWTHIKQRLWEWRGVWLTAPTIAGLLLLLRALGSLQSIELAAYDQFMRWRSAEPTDPRIVIIGMDEGDIRKLGWPLSDARLAELLEKIRQQQPRVIGLDIYRDLPVGSGQPELQKIFETTPNLLGIQRVIEDGTTSRVAPPPALSKLGQVAANDVVVDSDGKIRRGLLFPSTNDPSGQNAETVVPSLGLFTALLYLQEEGITADPNETGTNPLTIQGVSFVPLETNDGGYRGADTRGYQIMLNFRGRARHFQTVSVRDVISGSVPSNLFHDRIVLIGATAASLNDIFYTPYTSSQMPEPTAGVEIQANLTSQIISTVMDRRPLIRSWSESSEVLWLLGWATTGAVVSWVLRSPPRVGFSILLLGSAVVGGCFFLFLYGWWIPVVPALLGMVASAVVITGYIAVVEREDRQLVMNLFGRHVSPAVAEAIWRDRDQILTAGRLPGRRLTATVLFTDIRDFSSIAEQTDPEILMNWLNDYMEAMAQLVLEHNGVVDKFIGDAVMAVFGVPIPHTHPDDIAQDACNAVRCALAMAEQLKVLNEGWKPLGRPTAAMRVGISTGTVVAGSLGSAQRLDYTTIGDTVNIAARLESYSKSEHDGLCRILISQETYDLIHLHFSTTFVGTVLLKGRKQSVNAYRILPTVELAE